LYLHTLQSRPEIANTEKNLSKVEDEAAKEHWKKVKVINMRIYHLRPHDKRHKQQYSEYPRDKETRQSVYCYDVFIIGAL
jgi:hypothetical protein